MYFHCAKPTSLLSEEFGHSSPKRHKRPVSLGLVVYNRVNIMGGGGGLSPIKTNNIGYHGIYL